MWQAIYFSPNGGTRTCIQEVMELATSESVNALDLTRPANRHREINFSADNHAVVAVPVYCGRIPQIPLFDHLHGDHTPTLLIGVYGNRAYDDALLELKNQLTARGFHCIGAIAMLAPHCFVPQEVTPDRPDEIDRQTLVSYLSQLDWSKPTSVAVPGNAPYKPYPTFPFVPETLPGCVHCGACFRACPVGAIQAGGVTDPDKCIRCAACINSCPQACRRITHPGFAATQEKLRKLKNVRHEIECF